MTGIQQIALQVSGGFLAGVCVWLWLERKRRIRRERDLKELLAMTERLKSDMTETLKALHEANENALKHIRQAGVEVESERKMSFRDIYKQCREDGTCKDMNKDLFYSMTPTARDNFNFVKRYFQKPEDYYGPFGPMFCGVSLGICSSGECPKWKKERAGK